MRRSMRPLMPTLSWTALAVNGWREVAQGMVAGCDLDERRKGFAADRLGAFAARCERAAGRQMRDVGRQPGNLIERTTFFVRRVRHREQQPLGVGIGRPGEELLGR